MVGQLPADDVFTSHANVNVNKSYFALLYCVTRHTTLANCWWDRPYVCTSVCSCGDNWRMCVFHYPTNEQTHRPLHHLPQSQSKTSFRVTWYVCGELFSHSCIPYISSTQIDSHHHHLETERWLFLSQTVATSHSLAGCTKHRKKPNTRRHNIFTCHFTKHCVFYLKLD